MMGKPISNKGIKEELKKEESKRLHDLGVLTSFFSRAIRVTEDRIEQIERDNYASELVKKIKKINNEGVNTFLELMVGYETDEYISVFEKKIKEQEPLLKELKEEVEEFKNQFEKVQSQMLNKEEVVDDYIKMMKIFAKATGK